MDGASRTMTRLSLELGGNAPVLVLPDVDIEAVARGAVAARFRNAGQVCVSPQRFLIGIAIGSPRFEEIVVEETRALAIGSGLDPAVRIGPLISARHRDRVEALVAGATAAGATVRTGGVRPAGRDRGFFLEPTVLARRRARDAGVRRRGVRTGVRDDRLRSARRRDRARQPAPRYGLAAYVFTNDLAAAMRAYERLEFGIVGVNDWSPQATEAPFAGRKDSGIGHECGREGLLDNLETKLVSFGNVSDRRQRLRRQPRRSG